MKHLFCEEFLVFVCRVVPSQFGDRKGEPSLRAKPFGPCWGHSDQKLKRAIKMKQFKKKYPSSSPYLASHPTCQIYPRLLACNTRENTGFGRNRSSGVQQQQSRRGARPIAKSILSDGLCLIHDFTRSKIVLECH